jgi:negative regulator of sigma-B (phosphoserine phosphatase)
MDLRAGLGCFDHHSEVRPCRGESVSGDAVVVVEIPGGCFAAIVDVLGHGREAHDVAVVCQRHLARYAAGNVVEVMTGLHRRLRGSRGAAAGLCCIDAETGELEYVGTGNTVLRRFGSKETRLVSQDGVLGQNMRSPRPQKLHLEAGDLVLLYTDGIRDRFTLDEYRGVLHHDARAVARNIVERFGKSHDDAGCVAVRWTA